MSLEETVVAALRLESAAKVDRADGWELWKYKVRDPASQATLPNDLFLLFVNSKGLKGKSAADPEVMKLRDLRGRLRSHSVEGKLNVAVQRSSPSAGNLELVQRELGARSVKIISELLQEQWQHLLGDSHPEDEQVSYFVEPVVDDKLALSKLEDWLLVKHDDSTIGRNQQEEEPSLAVLLAPAGMGKTSVARELARGLRLRKEHDVIPILIEPGQWSLLNPHEEPTLWSLIEHALKLNGYNAVPREIFNLFAQTGYIITIFDGLDEVGSIRSGKITPVDVIDYLRNLASGSDCRVLLTSRDSLWSELVPGELRNEIREFKLLPFKKREIGRYREKRFPNPNSPARQRFDHILETVTDAVHPETTARVPYEERMLGTPLILELIATEAEEYSLPVQDTEAASSTFEYNNLLYTITHNILNREHEGRRLILTPAQQFMMISSLVVEMGKGPYSFQDIITTAEDALERTLPEQQQHALETALKSHALIRPTGGGTFAFRFDYLAQLAPAVWVSNYILDGKRDPIIEKYLKSIAGRSSPVSAFAAELLREKDWKSLIASQIANMRHGDTSLAPFFWEIAQSLLPPPEKEARSNRSVIMSNIFGSRAADLMIFSGLHFSGPVVYMDLRNMLFRECIFHNCEWINCEAGSNTKFDTCQFKGRFVAIQSNGLRSAMYEPLTELNVDDEARADLANLLNRPHLLSVSETAVARMATAILRPFRASGFYIPRTRDYLNGMFLEPAILRDQILHELVANAVLDEEPGRGLQIVKKNSASVTALLDNGTRKGATGSAIKKVVEHFKRSHPH